MKTLDYKLGDIVEMKKEHPCSSRSKQFEIVKLGADLKIRCLGCGGILIISRDNFNRSFKKVIK
ncbi:MAG: DUF951 domain-containing protein [Bacilli bacterium]|nr:DUF951 domain-containing protein [Bacilli bacterium]